MQKRRLSPDVRERERQYRSATKEQTNVRVRRRAARRLAGFVEDVPLSYLWERDKGMCQLCGDELSLAVKYPHPKCATQDHIIPLSKGGTHERRNLQLACFDCNRRKNNRDIGQRMLAVG
jgi:5-methylcytosine-specific restriction endonuclease McrA